MEKLSGTALGGVGAAILLAVSLAAPAGASPAVVTTHALSGTQTAIACLTPSRCVAVGYTNKVVGDVVALTNGVPGRTSRIAGSQSISGVSCPSSKGCWALVRTSNVSHAELVSINPAGVVAGRPKSFVLPSGAALFRISCESLKRCELVGDNIAVTP